MPNVRAALPLLALAAGSALAQDPPNKAPKPYESTALFASDTAIRVTLTGDWKALGGDRDTLHPKLRPGALSYLDAAGRPVRIAVTLSTRGHFRNKSANCSFPPLRVAFDSGGTKHTLFARQHALKLGTHCNDGDLYEQYVLREYLASRAHNLVTPLSFRPRLARVRYVDARDTTHAVERYGIFFESERELGARLGGKVVAAKGARYPDVTDSSAALLGLWEYFIGNTDFSMGALHNVRLVSTPAGMSAVPYDFDFSGLVDTRYASADPRLGLRSVRQRLYRGPCLPESQMVDAVARFTARRDAIRALYASLPALDQGYARHAVSYLDEFYDQARDARRLARDLRGTCVVGS